MPDDYLTISEFIERLPRPVDPRTVRHWIDEGKLRGIKQAPSPVWLIPRSEVERLEGESVQGEI